MMPALHVSSAPELSPTESIILATASSTLGRRLEPGDVVSPLSILGADSLGIIEITAAVEDALGSAIPADFAHESVTIREIAAWFDRGKRDTSNRNTCADPFEQMFMDSVLADDIRPGSASGETALLNAHAILLSGATGFLGCRLACDLLTHSQARLYCLVRTGAEAPEGRLRRQLMANGVDSSVIAGRVRALEGDLARPQLGLDDVMWRRLGETIDCVLHAGANVNWIAPYQSLRPANVLGTLELLRLACRRVPIAFHFVSSLSVCYAANGPQCVNEDFDPLTHLRGVHLGYAQTKIVAEALVREAGRRGLPVKIYRPTLISGDSRSGAFNPDDLLSVLIRGCVRMGTAADLDWALDCEPVDVVSRSIIALSQHPETTTHLAHARPRHWRECLLWMRLAGHRVRLLPYAEWLRQLDAEIASSSDHPLRRLRAFFHNRPTDGLTQPELYEDSRRTSASSARTAERRRSVAQPALDASLLDRYFAAYCAAGFLPTPLAAGNREPSPSLPAFDASFFEAALAARGHQVRVMGVTCTGAGSEHSIISELTAWRSGQPAGLFRYSLDVETDHGPRTANVVLKLKPHADDVIAVGEALAGLCDHAAGEAFTRWRDRSGLAASHLRERALYESPYDRLTQFMPDLLGVAELSPRGDCALVLEDVSDGTLIDSVVRTPWWGARHIDPVIRDVATIHGISYDATSDLRAAPWIGFVPSTASMSEMSDLWHALAAHAAPSFGIWGGSDLPELHRTLVDSIEKWYPALDRGPRTLIHHDFNPRNICLRERAGALSLCAYDWELATVGAPQRDLAELLCFVLPPDVSDETIDHWTERHRTALYEVTGAKNDREEWLRGFDAALNDVLVNRLAMYALIHRVRPQSFLPRIVATWRRIHTYAEAAVR